MTSSASSDKQNSADERLRLEFNDWAKAGRGEGMEKGHRPVGEQAIELMAIALNARVLDVGCGSGWASRLMAEKAAAGKVIGIDISDEMVRLSTETSSSFANIEFHLASAEKLPFADTEFSDAFSMESIYYYADMLTALKEIKRVLAPGGQFVTVVDLYRENIPSHQWIDQLKVPVQLLSVADYRSLFERAGFVDVSDRRLIDPTPIPADYAGGSFNTRAELVAYREAGSLMVRGLAT
ncbi:MAG TPA: methyltransferase domain-containing protein [Pyrinomonadaceae bacterium]|nr:methyltransferase domain-containing protein [Pyrinomonadaceae bacterium]